MVILNDHRLAAALSRQMTNANLGPIAPLESYPFDVVQAGMTRKPGLGVLSLLTRCE
jgi:hypothetical protein